MKKVIKFNCSLSSNKPNEISERQYFIDDVEVSILVYFDLGHLENAELQDLHIALQDTRKKEPADFSKFDDWQTQVALIEGLITKKVGHRFWADFII